ncbi:MAG: hypothetical protein JWO79_3014 [Actinomycetia bacterium]|nr:hypothetical protein [Actinomycetes bacterium]
MADDYEIRPAPGAFEDAHLLGRTAFHDTAAPEVSHELERSLWEPDRQLGAYYRGQYVGGAAAFTRDLTVPGGPIPAACVTNVAVSQAHTRRGLLTRMMRVQLTDLFEQGREPVAALWASESGIYRRFGYGLASRHAALDLATREVRLLRPVPAGPPVRVGLATDGKLVADCAAVYDRVRGSAPGYLSRPGAWWDHRLFDAPANREGNGPLQIVVHDGPDGPDGYALYAIEPDWRPDGPYSAAHLREVVAESPQAETALWAFLLHLDLVGRLAAWVAPLDTPLPHLIDHPMRAVQRLGPNLWIRIADLPRALAARTYAAPVDVVLDVTDEFCPWNTGRWRLSAGPDGATCDPTTDPADLALSALDLGAAYLGGTSLDTLSRTGSITELTPGALRATATAFQDPRTPFCPEIF